MAVSYNGGEAGKNHRPVASHYQTLSHNEVHIAMNRVQTPLVVICTDSAQVHVVVNACILIMITMTVVIFIRSFPH